MGKIIFIVAGAERKRIEDCVELVSEQFIEHNIVKDQLYSGEIQGSLSFINKCSESFTLPTTVLFSDVESGGNFEVYVDSTLISGNGVTHIPLKIRGVYRGSQRTIMGSLIYLGGSAGYTLNIEVITVEPVDRPPVAFDVTVELPNRTNTVVTKDTLRYEDPDGNEITHVRFNGNVEGLFNDSGHSDNYIAGTELPINFTLYFGSLDDDNRRVNNYDYQVKANGLWST